MNVRLPLWFRALVAALFTVLLVPFFLLAGDEREALARSVMERWSGAARPLVGAETMLGAGGAKEAPSGAYVVNGMLVRYRTFAVPGAPEAAVEKFASAFSEAGYTWRMIEVAKRPVLVAIHPETHVMLTVRPARDAGGRTILRLSEQRLSDLDPGFRAEIPGLPIHPLAQGKMLVRSAEGKPSTSLTYRIADSPAWAEQFYASEMEARGWKRETPPVALPGSGVTVLFFAKGSAECAVTLLDGGSNETLILVALTGEGGGGRS